MKKINLLFAIALLAIVAFFTSCDFTTSESPKITFSPDSVSVPVGVNTKVTVDITIEPDLLNSVYITEFYVDLWSDELVHEVYTSTTSQTITYEFVYTVSDTVEAGSLDFTVSAWDSQNNSIVEQFSIYVGDDENPAEPTIVTFTAKTIDYNNGSTSGWNSSKPFFGLDLDNIEALAPTATATEIDLALATQYSFGTAFCSPDAAWFEEIANYTVNVGWSSAGKNHTKLEKISVTNWETMTPEFIENLTVADSKLLETSAYGSGVDHVVSGDYIAFETEDGVKGVLKITDASNSVGTKATSSVTCDGKVLVPATSGK